MTSDLAIEAYQLTKRYGDVTAVDRFDLAVPAGTVVSLLGPNGAGKTTIVRMLATLAEPTSGTAAVFGYDIGAQPDAVRSVISLTGQSAALEDNLTARENLLLMARLLTTQYLDEADTLTDRIVLIDHGSDQQSCSPAGPRVMITDHVLAVSPRCCSWPQRWCAVRCAPRAS